MANTPRIDKAEMWLLGVITGAAMFQPNVMTVETMGVAILATVVVVLVCQYLRTTP